MNRAGALFHQLNIVSGDLAASVAFYRRLGVDIPEDRIWVTPGGTHHASAQAATDQVSLEIDSIAFARIWNAGWHGREDLRGRVVVGMRLPSRAAVDARYASLTGAGYRGLHAPHDAFWGARYAVVEDPDGIAVGLMGPISPKRRSRPPEVW